MSLLIYVIGFQSVCRRVLYDHVMLHVSGMYITGFQSAEYSIPLFAVACHSVHYGCCSLIYYCIRGCWFILCIEEGGWPMFLGVQREFEIEG